ncbi:MAG: HD-GYP domain-containing protein [Clostridia bacterium]|nr:HD-GYP domain-containing protein [Clostridia bacterium]
MIRKVFHEDYHDVIDCLVTALEARDDYIAGHSSRVGDMSYDIARAIGLRGKQLSDVHMAAHLHDIGKIGIPESILNKKGKLSPYEWAQIQLHPEIGYNILNKSKGLKKIALMVLHHHERWDGKGYPSGLRADRIPFGSRIIAVADAVDAMVSERPYRKAMTWKECQIEVSLNKYIQFDPYVVKIIEEHKVWDLWRERYGNAENISNFHKLSDKIKSC